MTKIANDLTANYEAFSCNLTKTLTANIAEFCGHEKLIESYARIAAINALKTDIVKLQFNEGAASFFFEAHNDILLSHVNASYGSWRPALQSLRSFMENTMAAIYFSEHPVEYAKWQIGAFVTSPKELRDYVSTHPKLTEISKELDLKALLDGEYATLSKAVHGSNVLFRMTGPDGKTNIANPSAVDLGKWSARERSATDICLTPLIGVLSDHLEGAKMQNLRTALRIALQAKSKAALKKFLNVSVPKI